MTVDGKGFLVERGTGKPTRVPVPKSDFKATSSDTGGSYSLGGYSTPGGFEHLMEDLTDLQAGGHAPDSPEWQAFEAKHAWTLVSD